MNLVDITLLFFSEGCMMLFHLQRSACRGIGDT
jgi:hypothetical protein